MLQLSIPHTLDAPGALHLGQALRPLRDRGVLVVGSGSLSFEMIRALVERLPVMITPKWLDNRIQPIAVRDVLHYLVRAADLPPETPPGLSRVIRRCLEKEA